MLQFPVPQFIDVEDKLIGPFSLKQFLFLLPGGLLLLALFKIFGLNFVFYIFGVPIFLLTVAVAFGRFNGKPIYAQFSVFVKFLTAPKRLVFHKQAGSLDDLNISAINTAPQPEEIVSIKKESDQSKLRRLSMLLDQKNQEEFDISNPQDQQGK